MYYQRLHKPQAGVYAYCLKNVEHKLLDYLKFKSNYLQIFFYIFLKMYVYVALFEYVFLNALC